jgi:HK97 family phage prohead protease
MKKEKETRSTKKCDYNIEELRDGTGKKILAGVIRYNTRSDPEAVYDEKLAPSVFTKTIKDGADVYCNVAHADKWSQIVGSTKSGTLRLENKPDGLYFYLDQIDTQASKDAFTLVSLGILRGVSFEFEDVNSVWGFDAAQQRQTRLIKE